MRLIVIPDMAEGCDHAEPDVLRHVLSAHPLAVLATEAARHTFYAADDGGSVSMDIDLQGSAGITWVIPRQWDMPSQVAAGRVIQAKADAEVDGEVAREIRQDPWLIISNGRFASRINGPLLDRVLAGTDADVVTIQAAPELRAYQERVRLTPQGELVGCRRLYRDVAEPAPVPTDWPHHLFIKTCHAQETLGDAIFRSFDDFLARCRALSLEVRSVTIAGTAIDLASSRGLLALSRWMLTAVPRSKAVSALLCDRLARQADLHVEISPEARLIGPILTGEGVRVEAGAVVVGPTVLCDHSTIGPEALVDVSVVGQRVTVDRGRRLAGVCELAPDGGQRQEPYSVTAAILAGRGAASQPHHSVFRTWPRFSYARCFKRVADVLAAVIVLALFAPIIPFIALAIKINSPGPVFYRDRRQGLHGRVFRCIKFRTMKVGAAEIQDKLRFVSEVDGPQFKINDDPRISGVGHFLRETSIDEIPQFFNVLRGQMSVVGPRPSPEAENTQCPSWRDARLSVRPGITGLWQVCRTRQPLRDFQEWIHYDTKYVRELSLRNDLWICGQTFKRLLNGFVEQF